MVTLVVPVAGVRPVGMAAPLGSSTARLAGAGPVTRDNVPPPGAGVGAWQRFGPGCPTLTATGGRGEHGPAGTSDVEASARLFAGAESASVAVTLARE